MIKCLFSSFVWHLLLFSLLFRWGSSFKCNRFKMIITFITPLNWAQFLLPLLLLLHTILKKVNISKDTSSNFEFTLFKSKQKSFVCAAILDCASEINNNTGDKLRKSLRREREREQCALFFSRCHFD